MQKFFLAAAATAALGTVAVGRSASDPVILAQTYKVGQKDNYELSLVASSADVTTLKIDFTKEVLKVYSNGDADIKTTASLLEMTRKGQVAKPPVPGPYTAKYDAYGITLTPPAEKTGLNVDFMSMITAATPKGLVQGVPFSVDRDDPASPGNHYKVTMTLASVKDGVAEVDSKTESVVKVAGAPDQQIDGKTLVDVASKKVNHVELHITRGGTSEGAPAVLNVTIDRKTS